jgi:hypothetical protein
MCGLALQDVTAQAQQMVELVQSLGQRYAMNYVLSVWQGSNAQPVSAVRG